MNYLELMVSAKPFLLVFIATRFESQMNGPAGPAGPGKMGHQDKWVIFQARSRMVVVCLRWKGVLILWMLRSGFLGVFSFCPVCPW